MPTIVLADTFMGCWVEEHDERTLMNKIPFDSEFNNELVIIHNDVPDRTIYYKIEAEDGNVLIEGCVCKEQSAQIVIPISELPNNKTYTIILKSPNPMDRVYSVFQK